MIMSPRFLLTRLLCLFLGHRLIAAQRQTPDKKRWFAISYCERCRRYIE
jgi:hypothetical protein